MDWLKPPLRKVRNRLSRSRPQSPNPSIDERDQDQSRSRPPASLESHLDTKSSPSAHAFTRSKNLQQDIGALYVAYVLQGSPGLRDLIHEVDRISLNEVCAPLSSNVTIVKKRCSDLRMPWSHLYQLQLISLLRWTRNLFLMVSMPRYRSFLCMLRPLCLQPTDSRIYWVSEATLRRLIRPNLRRMKQYASLSNQLASSRYFSFGLLSRHID